jgi:D-alanyl-D-alanine carboxypeptidase
MVGIIIRAIWCAPRQVAVLARMRMSWAWAASIIFLTGCTLGPKPDAASASPPVRSEPALRTDARTIDAALDDYLNAAVRHDYFSGTVLIAKDGKPIFEKSYGMANYELNAPNTAATVYQLQSVTKPFTAISIMMLQEEGALSVNDPICNHLEDCPEAWRPITIHHLLTHTSGIEGFSRLPEWDETFDGRTFWRGGAVSLVRDLPLLFKPGEKFHYSNSGYVLLARIIERRSGKTLADFYRERILSPLGMEHTSFNSSRLLVPNLATGYYSLGTSFINTSPQSRTHSYGDAGLFSTVGDLLIWDQALYSNKLISAASYEQMIAHTTNDYAYGWELRNWHGRREIGHAGSGFGFSTILARFIDDRLTVIVLTNSDEASAGRTAQNLAAIYFGVNYTAPMPQPAAVIVDAVVKSGVDTGIARYRELKTAAPSAKEFQNDELLVDLGYALYDAPLMDKAKRVFEFAIEEFPKSAFSYDGLADIAAAEGDFATAIRHFETSLKIDPDNDYAVKGLARVRKKGS